ncbi:MAG: 50S ribosomal protein L4 [Proteobacteria bacterium]|nr:50S ribosomal protein L4 [Pseudomonadota bacterium]
MKSAVINLDNKKVADIDLDEAIFGLPIRGDILARTINWQLAKRRAGTHKTKVRSEISGGGKKPWKQKGSGRARQGTTRAPQWRGGGIVFGPLVRDHATGLPKQVRKLALKTALSAKQADGKLIVLDGLDGATGKTSDLAQKIAVLNWHSALIVDGQAVNEGFVRAARNIIGLDVLPSVGANVYDIMRCDMLVLTRSAVDMLVERLK